jgi:2-hydroxy-3-keto-5-methylthiopentenyl-1-phosphate phosphatase
MCEKVLMQYKDTDIDNWPQSWARLPEDVLYGIQVLPYMKEFIKFLKRDDLTIKTVNRHIDALWALGGKIIDKVNDEEKNRTKKPLKLLLELIDEEGGPLIDFREEQASFDRTCKKFYKFLKGKNTL